MTTEDPRQPSWESPGRWYRLTIESIGGAGMAVIVVVMIVQVVMRYVFNASLIWAEELCRYILVWMTFLLVGVAFHRGELVAVELVTGALPPKARLALKILVTIPVIVFLAFIVFFGWRFASRMGIQTIPAIDFIWSALGGKEEAEVSVFWIYISAPVGCALLIAHMLTSLVLETRAVARGETIEPAVSTH